MPGEDFTGQSKSLCGVRFDAEEDSETFADDKFGNAEELGAFDASLVEQETEY